MLVIEAYCTLRDRGPYPADQVIKDLSGSFAFVVFDSSANDPSVFAALSSDGEIPLFWGIGGDGSVVICDDRDIAKAGCGKSYAPFPPGTCTIHSVPLYGLNQYAEKNGVYFYGSKFRIIQYLSWKAQNELSELINKAQSSYANFSLNDLKIFSKESFMFHHPLFQFANFRLYVSQWGWFEELWASDEQVEADATSWQWRYDVWGQLQGRYLH
jgi:hypothetical protein